MRIGILGTRGIPNNYGGFEQLAEYLSVALVQKGHEIVVYNSSLHSFKNHTYNGVEIVHCYDPENYFGTFGQFIYDFNCIINSRKQNFDVVLQLGYTSSSLWFGLHNAVLLTNMDGLEWRRSKYSSIVKKYLLFAERLAIKKSKFLIADSLGIKEYIEKKYNVTSSFISYGAATNSNKNESFLIKYNLKAKSYFLIIARLEPENNIETIIEGYLLSNSDLHLLIVGSTKSKFGTYLDKKYKSNKVIFCGSNYNIEELNSLRFYSSIYFHGHSVGGTNPSLLEAMACECLIASHNNVFNQSVLNQNAMYFSSKFEVKKIIETHESIGVKSNWIDNNKKTIEQNYNWDLIINEYEKLFKYAVGK